MIYLDAAATSLQKPEAVVRATAEAMRSMTSPGRGSHAYAMAAADCCWRCRERAAELFHVPDPERVVLTFNATHGLNIAIRSLVMPGTRVLISGWEHNAVLRPLHALGARIRVLRTPLFDPGAFLRAAERAMPWAELVICCHVSNVFGSVQPLEALAALCARNRKPLIVDAAQSAGTVPLDFAALGAAFVAMPGHKGLLGPQGTGLLLCQNDARPLFYGGSGSNSRSRSMPEFLPDRLEAGTPNVCGVAGLSEGLAYLLERGVERLRQEEAERFRPFAEALGAMRELECFDSGAAWFQTGILSVRPRRGNCEAVAEALAEAGVAVRSGLHCAPLAHETAGTVETGTLRFSLSPFTTQRELEQCADILEKILKKT